jgi:hypothetical protein
MSLSPSPKASADKSLSRDALSGIVCEDDSQTAELRLKRRNDKARPRVEVCAISTH